MYSIAKQLGGKNINRILSVEEERNAVLAWQNDQDEASRLLVIQSHVKIVMREIKRLSGYRANPEDLLSEGMVGLTIAIDRFDPDSGFRFYTYAIHWVRATLNAQILLTEGSAKMPKTAKLKRIFFSYRRATADIYRKSHARGENLSYRKIQELAAEAIGATMEDFDLVVGATTPTAALDQPLGTDGDSSGELTLMDTVIDLSESAEETINNRQVKKILSDRMSEALDTLNPRQRHIIQARKLVEEDNLMTLEDLSQIYKVSRERIRQVEADALKKMKKSLEGSEKILEAA